MRHQIHILSLAGCALACTAATADTVKYTVTDLGTVPGSNVCPCFFGIALSDNGHAVGRFFGSNGLYAGFIWENGVMTDMGSLGGGLTQVLDVRDDGVAVGHSRISTTANTEHAFRYQNGQMTDLGTLTGGQHSYARGINRAGVIAGMSEARGPANTSLQRATMWDAQGQPTDLGTVGGEFSEGNGINNHGQIVGWAWDPARRMRAFRWTPGSGMIDLGDLGAPGSIVAFGISDTGLIVGSAPAIGQPAGLSHAFLWATGVMSDLGTLPEAGTQQGIFGPELVSTSAAAVNSRGQVVGNSWPGTNEPPLRPGPFIWQNGVMTNLNDLVGPGWVILSAGDINEQGQIIGTAQLVPGQTRAVLLTPTLCYANCDDSSQSPALTIQDFSCFLNRFAAGDPYANCDASTTEPTLNIADFSCFLNAFAAGCP